MVTRIHLNTRRHRHFFTKQRHTSIRTPNTTLLRRRFTTDIIIISRRRTHTLRQTIRVKDQIFRTVQIRQRNRPRNTTLNNTTLSTRLTLRRTGRLANSRRPRVTTRANNQRRIFTIRFNIRRHVTFFNVRQRATILRNGTRAQFNTTIIRHSSSRSFTLINFLRHIFRRTRRHLTRTHQITTSSTKRLQLGRTSRFSILLFDLNTRGARTVFSRYVRIRLRIIRFSLPKFRLKSIRGLISRNRRFITNTISHLRMVALLSQRQHTRRRLNRTRRTVRQHTSFITSFHRRFNFYISLNITHHRIATSTRTVFNGTTVTFRRHRTRRRATSTSRRRRGSSRTLQQRRHRPRRHKGSSRHTGIRRRRTNSGRPHQTVTFLPIVDTSGRRTRTNRHSRRMHGSIRQRNISRRRRRPTSRNRRGITRRRFIRQVQTRQQGRPVNRRRPTQHNRRRHGMNTQHLSHIPIKRPQPNRI